MSSGQTAAYLQRSDEIAISPMELQAQLLAASKTDPIRPGDYTETARLGRVSRPPQTSARRRAAANERASPRGTLPGG